MFGELQSDCLVLLLRTPSSPLASSGAGTYLQGHDPTDQAIFFVDATFQVSRFFPSKALSEVLACQHAVKIYGSTV